MLRSNSKIGPWKGIELSVGTATLHWIISYKLGEKTVSYTAKAKRHLWLSSCQKLHKCYRRLAIGSFGMGMFFCMSDLLFLLLFVVHFPSGCLNARLRDTTCDPDWPAGKLITGGELPIADGQFPTAKG